MLPPCFGKGTDKIQVPVFLYFLSNGQDVFVQSYYPTTCPGVDVQNKKIFEDWFNEV